MQQAARVADSGGAFLEPYTWMAAHRPEVNRKGWWDRLVCLDTETGEAKWRRAGSRYEEPIARVWFDQEVPLGLHACRIPA